MLDESLPLTVGEFEEWGNPKKKDEYDYLKSYCPYTNLERKIYPTILVKTSFNDSQVMYWEPAKYVAKLRTLKTDRNPLVLKTNMGAGHGGAPGRSARAFRDELGIKAPISVDTQRAAYAALGMRRGFGATVGSLAAVKNAARALRTRRHSLLTVGPCGLGGGKCAGA